jgi:hypothetical protein
MTKYVSTMIGAAIIGAMGFSIWPVLWQTFGVMGGYMAAVLVVTVAWYLNHRCGLMYNAPGAAWVDMAWGIAIGGVAWALVRRGSPVMLTRAFPTLACAVIGGALGGVAAEMVKKWHPNFKEPGDGEQGGRQ